LNCSQQLQNNRPQNLESGICGSYLQIAIDEAINFIRRFCQTRNDRFLKSGMFNVAFCLTAMADETGVKQPVNRKRLRLIKQGRGTYSKAKQPKYRKVLERWA